MRRIAIIVDHPQRDLAGLVLTAFRLCQEGITCHLVPLNLQDRELWALAPDFVLLNFARRGTEQLAVQLRNARIKYGVLDTEGGVWGSLSEYSDTLWGSRSLLHGAECVCAWGPATADHVVKEGFFNRSQVTVTGCPRFDLYHSKWRSILAGDSASGAHEPRKRILINTNFTFSNPKFASVDHHLECVQQEMGWSLSRAMSVLSAGRAGLDATIDMVRNLSRDFPRSEIILRPHPFEQGEYYRTRLATLENVSIDGNGPVQLQIYRADVVVQRSCTTAIEAGMASVPTLSPQWVPPEMEMPAAEEVSTACISYQDLRGRVDEILAGCYDTPADTQRAIKRVIGKWFYYADGLAHQRVADVVVSHLNGAREVDERLCAKILYGVNSGAGGNFERLGRTIRYAFNLSSDWSFRHMRKIPSLSWATTNKFFGVEQVRKLAEQVQSAAAANGYAASPLRVEFARTTGDYFDDYHGHSITLRANQ